VVLTIKNISNKNTMSIRGVKFKLNSSFLWRLKFTG
jgi:hypothetical protein